MKKHNRPRIMIAATGSGSGKTSITCGLLQALINKGIKPSSFKCGPDYIDPMFHTEVLGVQSRNLDLFFMEENIANYLLCKNSKDTDFAVIEGVMGYYDGLAGNSIKCSSYDLARATKTPVILIADCKGMSLSVAALVKGFLEFKKNSNIQSVILNRIPPMLYPDIKEIIQEEVGVQVLGYLPTLRDCALQSRHLGLITAGEIENFKEIITELAKQIASTVDLDGILKIGRNAPPVGYEFTGELATLSSMLNRNNQHLCKDSVVDCPRETSNVKIAVAMDQAFCFYYRDNLDLLEELGAEILPFSPLVDEALPEGTQGLILGGGYPELYLNQLSNSSSL